MPRIVDHALKRRSFIRASCSVIGEEGLEAATLRRVAAEAGCTTGALTHYFPDREGLLLASLRAAHAAAADRMRASAAKEDPGLPKLRAVLLEALPLDHRRLREWRIWLAFWGAAADDSALRRENAARCDEWRWTLSQLLAPLASSPEEAHAEAGLLLALIDGLGLRAALKVGDPAGPAIVQDQTVGQLDRFLDRYTKGSASCRAPSPSP